MSAVDPQLIPKPRKVSRHGWIVAGVIGLVLAVLYLSVALAYNVEGQGTFTSDDSVATDGVITLIEPVAVDAQRNQTTVHFTFTAMGNVVDNNNRLTQNIRIVVSSDTGTDEFRFPAGDVLAQKEVIVGLDGEQAQYPFDSHQGAIAVMMDSYTKNADGSLTSTGTVYTTIGAGGGPSGWGVNGWDSSIDVQNTAVSALATLTFNRAFSTQIFAILLLVLVLLLAGIALTVGVLVFTQRRRAEIGLMAYAASLLFALPVLRNYMPNAPPIGASIDIYVYLWVITGAIVAVTLVVVSWIRQSRENLIFERQRAKEAAAVAAVETDQTGD